MFEAYTIGVKVSLVNKVSAGLLLMSRQFAGLNGQAKMFEARLKSIRAMATFGAGLFGGGALLAAPIIYAIDKAAALQRELLGVQLASRGTTQDMDKMRGVIEAISSRTIFNNIQVAEMAKLVATGTGLSAAQVTSILPVYAQFADVQALMKGTPYEESVTDAVRLAHTAQHYDAASLAKYLDLLTKASLFIPGGLGELGHALKYSQGVAKTALGVDDEQMVLLTALLNRLGFAGSRGGTNLIASMIRTIPGIFGSGLLKGKSYEALKDMGMIDKSGHSKFFTNGKFDTMKWMVGLSEFVSRKMASEPEAIARQDIMKDFQHAFGTQGARIAALLANPQALQQLNMMGQQFQKVEGTSTMQNIFADKSVWQKFKDAQNNFVSAMAELGYTLLPEATRWLTAFNDYMGQFIRWVRDNPNMFHNILKGLMELSLAMMFSGTVVLLSAGFRALAVAMNLLVLGAGGKTVLKLLAMDVSGLGASALTAAGAIAALRAGILGLFAFAGGYAIGSWLTDKYGLDKKIGGGIYDLTHQKTNYDPIAISNARMIQVNSTINMDGRKVATAVTQHQANSASSVPNLSTRFDTSMSPSPVITSRFGNI